MRHHGNFTVHSTNDVHTRSEKIALSQAPGIWVNESGLGCAQLQTYALKTVCRVVQKTVYVGYYKKHYMGGAENTM